MHGILYPNYCQMAIASDSESIHLFVRHDSKSSCHHLIVNSKHKCIDFHKKYTSKEPYIGEMYGEHTLVFALPSDLFVMIGGKRTRMKSMSRRWTLMKFFYNNHRWFPVSHDCLHEHIYGAGIVDGNNVYIVHGGHYNDRFNGVE